MTQARGLSQLCVHSSGEVIKDRVVGICPNLSLLREKLRVCVSCQLYISVPGWDFWSVYLSLSYLFQCRYFLVCLMCRSYSGSFWISFRGSSFFVVDSMCPLKEVRSGAPYVAVLNQNPFILKVQRIEQIYRPIWLNLIFLWAFHLRFVCLCLIVYKRLRWIWLFKSGLWNKNDLELSLRQHDCICSEILKPGMHAWFDLMSE